MSRKRRNHSPEFKSKVALAAIKGDQTLSELSRQYGINSNLIVKWKKLLIDQSSEVIASGKGLAPDRESEIQSLQAKIGQLTRACPMSGTSALGMENDSKTKQKTSTKFSPSRGSKESFLKAKRASYSVE